MSTNVKVPVVRYKRYRRIGDPASGEVYLLKRKPETTRMHTIEDLAREMEAKGTLTVGDVMHTMHELIQHLRQKLIEGDKVKIPGLGIFHTTFRTIPAEQEKECTVRNITRVNVRFLIDNSLRLVNTSLAPTRSNNCVTFEIWTPKENSSEGNGGSGNDGDNSGGGNGTNPLD